MSEKTPKTDPFREEDEFFFPGTDAEGLTEEEKTFTFDEDYLDADFPPRASARPKDDAPAAPEDRQEKIDALFSAMRRRTESSPDEPPASAAEEEKLADAFRTMARRESSETPAPARKRRRGLFRRPKREPEPVTVGRDLRADQMLVYDSELDEVDYTDADDLPEVRDYLPIRFRRYSSLGVGGGILYALFVISVSVVLACVAWLFASDVLALNKEPKNAIVTIEEYVPEGDDPVTTTIDEKEVPIKVDIEQVSEALHSAGIIEYPWLFRLFSQFSHAETKIDPGTFDVSTELDYRALVTALQFGSGNQEITRITFPEGYSVEQIFTLLEENHIRHKAELYDAAANYEFDYSFLEDIPYGDPNRLEGYLFPDTYDFYQGEDATVAINRFLRNTDNKLTEDLRNAAWNRGYSIREILTIASLIEKEAGSDEERPIMASVIYNRLRSGWKLQLDSTVNYIKGTSTFLLTDDDLAIDDPYNTYMYEGLPPGPICNPGLASIEAAIHPADTDYWYWYSVDGVTTFFTNGDDFNAFAAAHPIS